MDIELTDHVERERAVRGALGESMRALQDALAVPMDVPVWGRRVRAALTELAHDVEDHVVLTESEEGLYQDLAATAPRLTSGIAAQVADHRLVMAEVARLLTARDQGISRQALMAHRDDLIALLRRITRHRTRGSTLLYEAYAVDIGGSG